MSKVSIGVAAVIAVSAVTGGGRAFGDDLSGAYLGGNFGRARSAYDTNKLDAQYIGEAAAAGDTLTIHGRSWRRLSHVWWVNAGYLFTPYVGLDAAFLHAGAIKYLSTGSLLEGIKTESFGAPMETTTHGPALSVIGRLPLTDRLELSLRVGDYVGKATYQSNLTVGANSNFVSSSKSTSALLGGVGAAYAIGGHCSVRADFLHINKTGSSETGKFNVDMATAGVSFIF